MEVQKAAGGLFQKGCLCPLREGVAALCAAIVIDIRTSWDWKCIMCAHRNNSNSIVISETETC